MTTADARPEHSALIRYGYICAAAVFILSFLLYYATLAPTVTLVDSGELLLAAKTVGVAHPPGFPLYVMLAHVASLFPWGNMATRVHVLSAVFAALAAAMMTLIVIEASLASSASRPKEKSKQKSKKKARVAKDDEKNTLDAGLAHVSFTELAAKLAPAVAAGLLFAFSRTLWAYATIAEVYTLNAFLIALIFWLMMGWRRQVLTAPSDHSDRKLYLAATIFGLALGVHHVTVALTLPAIAYLVWSTEGKAFYLSRRFLYAALFAFAGLGVYLYLPIAASQSPLMNWGDPRTLERFWWHISGRQYQVYFNLSFSRLTEFFKLVSREFGFVWVPLALGYVVAGFAYLFGRDKVVFRFLLLVVVIEIAYCLIYEISEDKDAYYLPVFLALTIAASFGMRWFVDAIRKLDQKMVVQTAGVLSLLIVPLIALASNFAYDNRSRYYLAHDYVDNIFKSVEPRGMVLTSDWQVYAPSLYLQNIEGQRQDVIVLDTNLMRRTWYYRYLDTAYPELTNKTRDQINAFLEDLVAFDRDPQKYRQNTALNERINTRYYDVLNAIVLAQIKNAPIYVTWELTDKKSETDLTSVLKPVSDEYGLVPQGLVFRLMEKSSPIIPKEPDINIRGLNDRSLRFDDDDVVRRTVMPAYLTMLSNTGIYLESKGLHNRAVPQFQKALKIDPNFEPAKRAISGPGAGDK